MLRQLLGGLLRKPAAAPAALAPREDDGPLVRARAAARAGDLAAALALAEGAVRETPDALPARVLHARLLSDAGRHDEAIAAARSAVQSHPAEGDAHLALARALGDAGQLDDALLSMERAKGVFGAKAEFWSEFGLLHLRRGNLELAWTKLRRALSLNARDVPALVNLAVVAQRRGWRQSAVEYLERAVKVDPAHGTAWTNYGLALRDTDRLGEAIAALARAVALRPGHAGTLVNYASVLMDDGRYEDAEDAYALAIRSAPDHVEALVGLALSRLARGDAGGARERYDLAIATAPEHPLPRVGRAELDLWSGNFAEGWPAYEHRLALEGARSLPFPKWDGRPLDRGTLLVYSEQGLGDMVLFANCFPDLAGMAPRVVVEAPHQLVGLFARSFPELDVRKSAGSARPQWLEEIGEVAGAVAAGSLMQHFRPDAAAFPRHTGYLQADPERIAYWRSRLQQLGPGAVVGISWQGGVSRTGRKARSLAMDDLLPLLRLPGVRFVSLQYTAGAAAEVAALEREHGIVVEHWQDAIDDYEATAALVASLDEVVTCCTAVAHLACALGRPTTILAPAVPSWRYLGAGDTLPWYPAARVYRCTEPGNWASVVARAVEGLRRHGGSAPIASARRLVPLKVAKASAAPKDEGGGGGPQREPADAQPPIARARALFAAGDVDAAVRLLEDELAIHGDWADGYAVLASLYVASGAIEAGRDCLELALQHDPRHVEALRQMCTLLEREGRLAEAAERLAQLAEVDTESPDTLESLGRVLRDLKRYDEAIAACRKCLERWPDRALALGLLGNSLIATEAYDEGLAALERYLALSPELVSAHLAIGAAYLQAGRYADARAHLEWGISREPNNATARWDYALVQLADGEFERGWDNYFFRSLAFGGIHETVHLAPWKGEPLRGERLVVLAEQGLGDEIMFSSCVPDVLRRCDDVVMTCDRRLLKLFGRSFPEVRFLPRDDLRAVAAAGGRYECLIGNLPSFFRRSQDQFPRHSGYLRADPERVAYWRDVLAGKGAGPTIGVSWRGGTAQSRARLRSIPIDQWGALLGLPGAVFVNLQYGKCEQELEALHERQGVRVHHFKEAIADYDETAALVASLDLVVTVCTAIVHLSGALGRPVWVLTPSAPEWRYGTSTQVMPWYPSSRLFRQAPSEPWSAVLDRVRSAAEDRLSLAVRADA